MSGDVQWLEPLVGEWTTEVRLPGQDEVARGRTTFHGRLGDDGMTIEGAWEICEDGETWCHASS